MAHLVQEGMLMPVRLMMWFCRVALRMMKASYRDEAYNPGLEREFNDLMKDLNEHLWPPDGKPPAAYED
jgi:hypothetical protein